MLTVNTKGFQDKLAKLEKRRPIARERAVLAVVGQGMTLIVQGTPVDTGRLINGYIQAGREAGLDEFVGSMRLLRPSKYTETAKSRLQQQLQGWLDVRRKLNVRVIILTRTLAKLERNGGSAGVKVTEVREQLKMAQKKLNKADKNIKRAMEEIEKLTDTSIVIGLLGTGRAGRAIGTTVSPKVYGGEGRLIRLPDATYIRIRNKEPHAAIIEARLGTVRNAKKAMQSQGVGAASREFRKFLKLT